MNKNTANFIWVFANIIFFTIGLACSEVNNFYLVLSVIGVLQLAIVLFIIIKMEKKLFSPIIIYEIVMYAFLFGQCLLWIITKEFNARSIIKIYSLEIIEKAEIFTLFCMFFFHFALFGTKERKKKILSESQINSILSSMYFCGIVFLCVSIVPEIVYNVRIFVIAQTLGYIGIYTTETSSVLQFFLNIREFFFPAVVLILCSGKLKNYVLRNILICFILADAIVNLYVGSRADAIMQIISFVLMYSIINEDKMKKKSAIKYVVLFIVLILAANVVRIIRTIPGRSIGTFFEYLFSPNLLFSDNIFFELIAELGNTMSTLIETMLLVPSQYNYLYGTSYLYALTWILPGFITGNIWMKASMNSWLDTVRYTGSGWGFSTTAEAYFNFGNMGVLVFLIAGVAIAKLLKKLDRPFYQKNPIEFALSFILFNRVLIFSRIDFLSTLPSIVYFYFGIKLLVYFVDSLIKRKEKLQ